MKRIVQSGSDRLGNYRVSHLDCPHCDYSMKFEDWRKAATTLILNPRIQKTGNVAVMSECPKCFEGSWTHYSYDYFHGFSTWSEKWKKVVQKIEAEVKLKALRDWAKGLCGKCALLKSGSVSCTTNRHCEIGSGPVRFECRAFKEAT